MPTLTTSAQQHPAVFANLLAPTPALLALADGSVFHGHALGAEGVSVGEVVFNTAMTGYQEILTDPSYARQLVTLTYPHIGNVGVNEMDAESSQVHAAGLIIREAPLIASSWRSEQRLQQYLIDHHIVALAGIDTRALTKLLREQGAQNGCIVAGEKAINSPANISAAVAKAREFGGLAGLDLAREVSTKAAYKLQEGIWDLSNNRYSERANGKYKVVALDFGVKRNILRLLNEHDCAVEILPATSGIEEILARDPDGVFLSNGPGDPEPCTYAINAIGELLQRKIPVFGICLGHQLLALASGAKTIKMKFGHHGANHPVQDLRDKKVMITSQNHGFAVDEASLPSHLRATHRSLFDGSLQGVERLDCPAFSFQGHPEASPGPRDVMPLFAHFVELMQAYRS